MYAGPFVTAAKELCSKVNNNKQLEWWMEWLPLNRADAKRRWLAMPLRKRLELQRFPRWLWPTDDPKDIRRVLMQFTRHRD